MVEKVIDHDMLSMVSMVYVLGVLWVRVLALYTLRSKGSQAQLLSCFM